MMSSFFFRRHLGNSPVPPSCCYLAVLQYAPSPADVYKRQILTLSATDMRGQLRIVWDGASRLIRHATGGSIDIDDHGVRTQLSLTPADLRSGSIFYARQSGDVSVRLTVDVPGSSPIVQATRFLKPGESGTAPAPRLDAAKRCV